MSTNDKLREDGNGMSMIVKTVTRWLKGPIFLFGIYLVLYGHITPGGGFGGGVVIASAFILITLAMGQFSGLQTFSKAVASRLDSVGLLLFLAIGWLGTWWAAGHFFENFITTPAAPQFTLTSAGTTSLVSESINAPDMIFNIRYIGTFTRIEFSTCRPMRINK